jgi:cytochrome c biogenesis protein CcdA
MDTSVELVLLLLLAFGIGILKGSSVCTAVCIPALLSYFLEKGYSWKKTLEAAIVFNIPRVFFFVMLGMMVGYLSFELSDTAFKEFSEWTGLVGYLIVSFIVLVVGARLLVKALDEREDLEEGKLPVCQTRAPKREGTPGTRVKEFFAKREFFKPFHRDFYKDLEKHELKTLLLWGTSLALGCSIELSLVEGTLFSGTAGSLADNTALAMFYGGLVMLFFGLGASIPTIIISVAGVRYSQGGGEDNYWRLNSMKIVGAGISLFVGLVLLLLAGGGLLMKLAEL